jgi:hypothetical protein
VRAYEDLEGVALAAIKNRKRPMLQNGEPMMGLSGGAEEVSAEVRSFQPVLRRSPDELEVALRRSELSVDDVGSHECDSSC